MYKTFNSKWKLFATLFLILTAFITQATAQISFSGQIRTRGELRNGLGTLRPLPNDPSALISQRTRINFAYKWTKVLFQTSVQDVRVWGQDASTINSADGNRLGIHEAWAELILSDKKDTTFKQSPFDYLSIKIGRQEIAYEDQKLLGNLDWLQQGRRHDAIILKLQHKDWIIDAGAAFNQNSDAFNYNGTYYTPANIPATVKDSNGILVNTPAGMIPLTNSSGISSKNGSPSFTNPPSTNAATQTYKAMQYLYFSRNINKSKISGLFFQDQFGKYILDSVKSTGAADAGYIYGRRFNQKGSKNRYTTGLTLSAGFGSKSQFQLNAGIYYQGGKDRDALTLSASMASLSLAYTSILFTYTAGIDYLSGNSSSIESGKTHRFDPLYGTPHKFWGYMDYFYAGTGSPAGGLNNPFLKIKYTSKNKRLTTGLDYHYFSSSAKRNNTSGNELSKYLGSEFDLVNTYTLNKISSVELGLAYMAASASMEYAKSVTPNSTRLNNSWAYLQINIKPDFLQK